MSIGMLFSVPPFPGAVKTLSTFELCDNFQDRACSRPPEPITKTLTNKNYLSLNYIIQDIEMEKSVFIQMRVSTFLPTLSGIHRNFLDVHRIFLCFVHMILPCLLEFYQS
jgi:hypothetical protein